MLSHIAESTVSTQTTLDLETVPVHVGIIMDGNGRWAKARKKPRTFGHREGLEASKRIVRAASRLGIQWLSLYTFSTENWKRAEDEVSFLMNLIQKHLRDELDFYRENQIRIVHSGDIEGLPGNVQKEIRAVIDDTKGFTGMTVNLAINYGGKDEMIRAFNRVVEDYRTCADEKKVLAALNESDLNSYLDVPALPEVDLIIRTGGEQRISNFLLWKSAYSELVFSEHLWPDWNENDLVAALIEYRNRNRRFGGTS